MRATERRSAFRQGSSTSAARATSRASSRGPPDFNHDNPEVLDFFINNIEDWIADGKVTNIRMDTVKHVERKFWHYFKSQIRGEHRQVRLIGEVLFEGKQDVAQLLEYQNYHDFDSIFDFPLARRCARR